MIDSPTVATCYPDVCLLNYVRYVVNGAEAKRSVTTEKMPVGGYSSRAIERDTNEENITQIAE